ncbi:MAG: hypothetical protein M9924_14885 [Rhizobiaceae bacterium]|nr:hypothetical protein [Rhizobiaceae bacterium]
MSTRLQAQNVTADVDRFPGTIALGEAEFRERVDRIAPAINAIWNAGSRKIRIRDEKCGERIYDVEFNVVFAEPPHYKIEFVNVPETVTALDENGEESYDTYTNMSAQSAKFNLGDTESAANNQSVRIYTEPHEYGHMIGLLEEYADEARNIRGCLYRHFGAPPEIEVSQRGLMGHGEDIGVLPARYFLPVADAVLKMLEAKGVTVTAMEIIPGPSKAG